MAKTNAQEVTAKDFIVDGAKDKFIKGWFQLTDKMQKSINKEQIPLMREYERIQKAQAKLNLRGDKLSKRFNALKAKSWKDLESYLTKNGILKDYNSETQYLTFDGKKLYREQYTPQQLQMLSIQKMAKQASEQMEAGSNVTPIRRSAAKKVSRRKTIKK